MRDHECKWEPICTCSQWGTEPSEYCEVHGVDRFPKRCTICGKFIKIIKPKEEWRIQHET